MGLFNLFSKKKVIAELTLNNSLGELSVSDNLLTPIPKEHFLNLVFFSTIPTIFFLADSSSARMVFIDFLKDLSKENFKKWTSADHLPEIDNFKITVYKNNEGRPYVKTSIIWNELGFYTLMVFFIIYLYENIQDKSAIKSFLEELLSGISTIPPSALGTYNYIIPISTTYFDKLNIKL